MKKQLILTAGLLTAALTNAAAPVELVPVQKKDLSITTTQPVSLEAFHSADLGTRVTGYVREVLVDIGSPVKKGQPMVRIDAPELVAAAAVLQAEIRNREAAVAAAESENRRVQDLAAKGSITEKAAQEAQFRFDQAVAAKAVTEAKLAEAEQILQYTEIPAPFDGIVSTRNVDPGDLVAADSGHVLLEVASVTPLRAVTYIPEREAVWLNNGDRVGLTFDAYPGQTFSAKITRSAGVLDGKTRRMRTEIDLDNQQGLLYPGMYGKVTVELEYRRDALILPAGSVRLNDGAPHVYAVENEKIKRIPVTTGSDTGTEIEILSGLTGTEQIVANSLGRLRDGDAVSVKARK
ncbi:efflux RND transporter periplasmic adaptor subunit [Pontiella agarivorans]|uniref:Efflux RND transporter periplasmic adaptor subunit n=1 Tax=Pontiella agarivorans TaxID=3038953 RepID=A0ABU5N130_9BACT|nr:efflux RND transporter periplasmic adaptor subunit [Pontiella agarivorans]MDZ8120155.1 efflux RND transporter periplasmic adaptor subunit [Pontiella agarivorans]